MTEKLKKCPICNGKATIVSAMEEYQNFIVVCNECRLYTRWFTDKKELIRYWNTRAADENPPLTVEELRQMNGEPVWIVAHPDWGHWELSMDAEDYLEDRDTDLYGLMMPPTVHDPAGKYGLNVLGWFAYRRKLEEK